MGKLVQKSSIQSRKVESGASVISLLFEYLDWIESLKDAESQLKRINPKISTQKN